MVRFDAFVRRSKTYLLPMLAALMSLGLFLTAASMIGFGTAVTIYMTGAGAAVLYIRAGTPRCKSVQAWIATYHDEIFGFNRPYRPLRDSKALRGLWKKLSVTFHVTPGDVLTLKSSIPLPEPGQKDHRGAMQRAIAAAARRIAAEKAIVVDARQGAQLVGLIVALRTRHDWKIPFHWITSTLRGNGVGARLLDDLLAEIDGRGYVPVLIELRRIDAIEELYRSRGFRPVELLKDGWWLHRRPANFRLSMLNQENLNNSHGA